MVEPMATESRRRGARFSSCSFPRAPKGGLLRGSVPPWLSSCSTLAQVAAAPGREVLSGERLEDLELRAFRVPLRIDLGRRPAPRRLHAVGGAAADLDDVNPPGLGAEVDATDRPGDFLRRDDAA